MMMMMMMKELICQWSAYLKTEKIYLTRDVYLANEIFDMTRVSCQGNF